MKKQYLAGLAVVGLLAMNGPSHATSLEVSGMGTMAGVAGSYQLIYDADKDITWLDYTKGYANWSTQQNWAANLAVTVNGVTYDNWRLPNAGSDPVVAYNQTTSEMGHLYYSELGLLSFPVRGNQYVTAAELNAGVFDNLVAYWYWSGTDATYPDSAWSFRTDLGSQFFGIKSANGVALAVLPGRIQAVPEPASVFLIGSGLAALAGLRRKK